MNKLFAILALFRRGEEVLNPAAWKTGQITVNAIYLLLVAVLAAASAFGYPLLVDNSTLMAVSAALFSIVNGVLTVVTSRKVGVRPKDTDDLSGDDQAAVGGGDPRGNFSDGS